MTSHDADFFIEIDYVQESPEPSRIFRTLTDLIEVFQNLDSDLVKVVSHKIEPLLLLEYIETGSIRVWLRHVLKDVDDEALKSGDWKKLLGSYLVKAKHAIIKWTEGKTEISDQAEILDLQGELIGLAEETDSLEFPMYGRMPQSQLLEHVKSIGDSTRHLIDGDRIAFSDGKNKTNLNLSLKITPENIRGLLTKETYQNIQNMILKIKKPDFLGNSQWEFRHGSSALYAKIIDEVWLEKFHSGKIRLSPGDALKAKVEVVAHYGHDGGYIDSSYRILEIFSVEHLNQLEAETLNFSVTVLKSSRAKKKRIDKSSGRDRNSSNLPPLLEP